VRIDVAFTPAADGAGEPAAVAIVIDVLRATTTITCALEQGYRRVLACGELDDARALARRLGEGTVLAGERACVKPEGFDLGNSPREFTGGDPLGETLVLTTTNGTRAIVAAAAHAQSVLIGSLVNLTPCAAAAAKLARQLQGDVLVQCAGVKGRFTMDDAYTAGRYVTELAVWLSEWERSDAARAAEAIVAGFPSAGDGLAASQSARNLRAAELYDDVRFCARESVVDVVARVGDLDAGVALIEPV